MVSHSPLRLSTTYRAYNPRSLVVVPRVSLFSSLVAWVLS